VVFDIYTEYPKSGAREMVKLLSKRELEFEFEFEFGFASRTSEREKMNKPLFC
jgi:hypothetical protein